MLILPERGQPRGKILWPMHRREWCTPSQAQPKDQFGRENRKTFAIIAHNRWSQAFAWKGWFRDREDADAFLYAAVTGSLRIERELWRLPSPWFPDLRKEIDDLVWQCVTYDARTSPTGSLQTWTSPGDWNNSNNGVYCLGSGANGGVRYTSANAASGGGGGGFSAISNFTVATPGTTTASFQIGAVAAQVQLTSTTTASGNIGNPTWFNNATDPGVGADNTKCSAAGGDRGTVALNPAGGAGGATASAWGTTKNAGGRGGTCSTSTSANATGGGGAGGPNGAGVNGVDATNAQTAGGAGDNTAAGAGAGTAASVGAGNQVSSNGGNGNEWGDSATGSGGGSGACRSTSATSVSASGVGGNYGAGTGAATNSTTRTSGSVTSGASGGGAILIFYTPVVINFVQNDDSAMHSVLERNRVQRVPYH